MYDILVSFGLGILLGVCLTLLTINIRNKRKAQLAAKISGTVNASDRLPPSAEQQRAGLETISLKTGGNLDGVTISTEIDELEGFVRIDGGTDMRAPEAKLAEIRNELPSDGHLDNEWIEAERVEAARVERELQEAARLEAMHHATDHFDADHPDAEELINLSLQQEFAALQTLQALQIEVARVEAERIEEDRIEAERIEAIRLQAEFAEAERAETARVEAERIEAERRKTEHAEAERIQAEIVEAERLEADRVEAERLEAEHAAAEQIEAERIEAERAETERVEAERAAAEQIEAERIEAERAEAEQLETERVEAERLEAESIEAERLEAERLEGERIEVERIEAERLEAERIEAERIETELLEQEFARLQAAQQVAELAAKEAATLEIEHASKRAAEEAALQEAQRQKQAADKLAAEQAEAEVQRQLAELDAKLEAEPDVEPASADTVPTEKIRKAPEDTLIMIADDSKVVRVKTSRVLTKHLYQVTLAEDGNEAASQLDFIMPDLLITDVEMPGMDGFELTQHLRSNPATAKLPIIMISGGSDELVEKAKLAGIDVLLGKPYSDEDLLGHIRRLTHGA